MEVWTLKLIVLLGLFVITYIFALIPVKILSVASYTTNAARRSRFDRAISFLSCFAAGVFLATCLLDIYPDVEELLEAALKDSLPKESRLRHYPLAASVVVVGFFLVLIVEQIVLSVKESHHETDPPAVRAINNPNYGAINDIEESERLLNGDNQQVARSRSASVSSTRSITGISDHPVFRNGSVNASSHEHHDHSIHQDPSSHSPVRSFILLAALSLHSIFEGLAVGLQETVAKVLGIFGAIVLHKCIIAFSVGLNLAQSKMSLRKIISSSAVFCASSPLGIGVGILIDKYDSKSSANFTTGILQGLACGTFLYVTFFEVLPHEFNKPKDRIFKLIFLVLGILVVNCGVFLEIFLTDD